MAYFEDSAVKYRWGIYLCITLSLAAFINLILIIIFSIKLQRLKCHQLAFLNLAVSDLMLAVFGLSVRVPSLLVGSNPGLVCQIGTFVSVVVTYANLIAVMPLTLDRIVAVFYPLKYCLTTYKKILFASMAVVWVLPLAYVSAILIFFCSTHSIDAKPVMYYDSTQSCTFGDWYFDNLAHIIDSVMFLEFFINIVAYTLILTKLHKRKRRSLKNLKILLRAIIIVVFFTLSWLPWVVVITVLNGKVGTSWMMFAQMFFYINCLTDPVLYTCASPVILKLLKRLKDETASLPKLSGLQSRASEAVARQISTISASETKNGGET